MKTKTKKLSLKKTTVANLLKGEMDRLLGGRPKITDGGTGMCATGGQYCSKGCPPE